ncbi:AlpA family transcriptional regulator [Janthinobacterium sp. 67]|nr:AlpA family transcriptional regulator [Janthinobacterium sp. 67]
MNGSSMNSTLVDLNELSTMLGRSPETIKKDLKRNRLAVPPRLHIPGTRLLRWRQIDIDRWLASHVESQVEVSK